MINNILQHLGIVLLPLLISNVLHMLVVKHNYFKCLKLPVSKKAFGENKTWRGFVFVSLVNAFVLYIIEVLTFIEVQYPLFLGFVLGLAYMLFELPNSLMKRQLGIQSGVKASSNEMLFTLIDKTDSALGVNLIYFFLDYVNFEYAIVLFLCCSITHFFISKILLHFNLKKSF
ncbi:CDP-archaeol synthase [uncultured Psychroserpens sp.]|uniref:CDP-archaeol synthase n=1 Tax=uncultured Psychroserpens sp. TaxID=255436 RepID=UPI00260FB223|nr:CDP-archaeol synthase [uncultured Psychroserpens sp.]